MRKNKNENMNKNKGYNKRMKTIKNKNVRKTKKIKMLFIILLLFLIFVGVYVCVNTEFDLKSFFNKNKNENVSNEISEGLIDMSNIDNVKIENGIKENVSDKILKDRNQNNFIFSNVLLNAVDGISNFSFEITNNSKQKSEEFILKIRFLAKNGDVIHEGCVRVSEMESDTSNIINYSTIYDIANAYDYEIEVID